MTDSSTAKLYAIVQLQLYGESSDGYFDGANAKQALRNIKADQKEQEKAAQKALVSIKSKD